VKADKFYIDEMIINALKEDMPLGDITTDNIIDENEVSTARFIAKADGVLAGLYVAQRCFEILDENVKFNCNFKDGDRVVKGDIIAEIEGKTACLLKSERTALNYLQKLSGIATDTARYVDLIKGYDCKVADTRKTTPGMRFIEKYAVQCGGGSNHRYSLSDGVLIKDNHIKAAGGIGAAVERVRKSIPHTVKIEVEVEDMDMVKEALEYKADIIMLDNMSCEQMKEAVELIDGRALVEASGDINDERIKAVAETGVDIISIGRLTRVPSGLDISMRF